MKALLSIFLIYTSLQVTNLRAEEEEKEKKGPSKMQKILDAEKQRRIDELNGNGKSKADDYSLDDQGEFEESEEKDGEFQLDN